MQDRQVKTFEYEKVTVRLHYGNLPTKKDLEEACINFFKKYRSRNKRRIKVKEIKKEAVLIITKIDLI